LGEGEEEGEHGFSLLEERDTENTEGHGEELKHRAHREHREG
jgi:hypothetical protein